MARATAYFLEKTGQSGYVSVDNLQGLAVDLGWVVARVLLPFLVTNWLLAVMNQLLQHGFQMNPGLLAPKFSKLNPASGFKRILSPQSAMNLAKSLFKFVIIAWVAYGVVAPRMPAILSTMNLSMKQSLGYMQETLFVLYRNIMLVMIALAAVDFMYQRHVYEEGMKMTKQEVKDEAREAEGNPEIKQRQRSMLYASAMRRILTQVPKASVVITNPTHFAVALRYDPGTSAPVLVAKGVDHLALKIRERATLSGVAIVENPPLARAIYHNVELDRPIPADLYQAVAQVLAFVYRLRGAA
jgi:flagellar biosynthesis protein FlhB